MQQRSCPTHGPAPLASPRIAMENSFCAVYITIFSVQSGGWRPRLDTVDVCCYPPAARPRSGLFATASSLDRIQLASTPRRWCRTSPNCSVKVSAARDATAKTILAIAAVHSVAPAHSPPAYICRCHYLCGSARGARDVGRARPQQPFRHPAHRLRVRAARAPAPPTLHRTSPSSAPCRPPGSATLNPPSPTWTRSSSS